MAYELWDTATRNIIGTFGSEGDARDAACDLVALNPRVYPVALALVCEDDEGETTLIARGVEGFAAR